MRASAAAMVAAPTGVLLEPAAAGAALAPATHWLGRDWWGNRLQDWVLRGGRLECVASTGRRAGRTVSALTWEVVEPSVLLRVRTGTLTEGAGFSGFVVGTGRRGDDWRTRVLVGRASGTGGGFLATYESDGTVRFREHTDEQNQLRYAEIPSTRRRYAGPRRRGEDVVLELSVQAPVGRPGRLLLRAFAAADRTLLASAELRVRRPRSWVLGGVGLMSSDRGLSGARYWFSDFVAKGPGARRLPQRGLGPIVGTLFTVSECGLKMTAQLMPVDPAVVTSVTLEVRRDGAWQPVATGVPGAGYVAALHVADWDSSRAHRYRVVAAGHAAHPFGGTVPAQPRDREVVIASLSCIKATHRPLDRSSPYLPRLPEESPLGLYTSDNVWFPNDRLARAMAAHRPDLLVAHGDQLYEYSPTDKDTTNHLLDFLGKYLLWLWSFRDLTRSVPTVVLADDHDVYQKNLWGSGGIAIAGPDPALGGFRYSADWINVLQQTVCGHNPDPFDPTPVEQEIGVYYGGFTYGGVSFAVLEDRKFKTGPAVADGDPEALQLLGERQERFLEAWAGEHTEMPKVVLTQTTFACLQTNASGTPRADLDTNGWPAPGRDRALRLIRNAGAVILSGDQHIGHLVRHRTRASDESTGTDVDGPLQFTVPAGSASCQRWFEPGLLRDAEPVSHLGPWRDAFDNPVDVLAVVQPDVTRAQHHAAYRNSPNFGDRSLKKEGYGITRVDPAGRALVMECWPWNVDPSSPGAGPYPGFSHATTFDDNLTIEQP